MINYNELMNMDLHQAKSIDPHFILRVVGGWIYTDRRKDKAPSGVFVPITRDCGLKIKESE